MKWYGALLLSCGVAATASGGSPAINHDATNYQPRSLVESSVQADYHLFPMPLRTRVSARSVPLEAELRATYHHETSPLERRLEKARLLPFLKPDIMPGILLNVTLNRAYGFPPELRDERYDRTAREAAGNVASAMLDLTKGGVPGIVQLDAGLHRIQDWADQQRVHVGRGSVSLALNFNVGSAVGLKYTNSHVLRGLDAELYPRGFQAKVTLLEGSRGNGWKLEMELYHRFSGGNRGAALVFTTRVQ